jgi:hypothetical protein
LRDEQQKLQYLESHQREIHADLYSGVVDAVNAGDGHLTGQQFAKRVILPATHLGSPRCMQQLYRDAMAIVRSLGKPDLFITMTCNPKWEEIQLELMPHQAAADRPDLVTRVFNQKLCSMTSRRRISWGKSKAISGLLNTKKGGTSLCSMFYAQGSTWIPWH